MTTRSYPISLSDLEPWRIRQSVTAAEARKRFVQFVLLESVAAAPALQTMLSFKGGNALRFIYGNRRSTVDLDFSAAPPFPDDAARVRQVLDEAFTVGGRRFGIKARCQRVRRNPPGADKTFPTYKVRVGYAFPEDRYFAGFETRTAGVSNVVEIEISLNDIVCESWLASLQPAGGARVRVCALEDILAEKLRALLQQVVRKRHRRQDVFDIARMLRDHGPDLDRRKIGEYLIR